MSEKADLLPLKSKERYLKNYNKFMRWKQSKGIDADKFSGSIMLQYFEELPKSLGSATLWAIYSMLKATIAVKHDIDIREYVRLTAYLKRKAVGYIGKKSKVFTADEIEKFIADAPDDTYLVTKVGLIFGVNGGCRSAELVNTRMSDIEMHNEMLLVNLPSPSTNVDRSFVIRGHHFDTVKKYLDLRPRNLEHDRFFLNYQDGKCTRQPIGKHKIASFPKNIAMFLKLPMPGAYTGHCFRKTSTSLRADGSTYVPKPNPTKTSDATSEDSDTNDIKPSIETFYVDPTDENALRTIRTSVLYEESMDTPSPTFEIPITSPPPSPEAKTTDIHVQGKNISLTFNNCPNACINLIFSK